MRTRIFTRHPKTTITILVLGALICADFLGARALKLYLDSAKSKQIQLWRTTNRQYRTASDIYHHDLAKNVDKVKTVWGNRSYSISTDSLGFRADEAKTTPLLPTHHRIVFIGDSFTEGMGMPYENTFVGVIANGLGQRNVEVLNAGVTSYSPIIYYRKIKYLLDNGFRFDELVVFVDISDIQDEAIHYAMSPKNTVIPQPNNNFSILLSKKWKHKLKFQNDTKAKKEKNEDATQRLTAALTENSIILSTIVKLTQDQDAELLKSTNRERSLWTIHKDILEAYGKKGLRLAKSHMDQLYQLLQRYGVKLNIAVYPWPDQVLHNDLNSIQVKQWKNWAQHRQIDFLNYFPCFVRRPNNNTSNGLDLIKKYYIKGDVHWNEEGHKLVAREYISYYSGQEPLCVEKN